LVCGWAWGGRVAILVDINKISFIENSTYLHVRIADVFVCVHANEDLFLLLTPYMDLCDEVS